MSRAHDLVIGYGRDGAKQQVPPDEHRYIDVAAKVLAEESSALGITYSGFCMTSLPHRKIPDTDKWVRRAPDGRFELVIEPGELRVKRQPVPYGVPYGSRARLIMLYLQTRAVQTNSREVELGATMGQWLSRMGISIGGRTYEQVYEQTNRIKACRLAFYWDNATHEGFDKDHIVKGGVHLKSPGSGDPAQGVLWEEKVTLGETFFAALRAHPVPIWAPAIREIANQSLTIDVYVWLAYRLRSLKAATPITWAALHGQFGSGYQHSWQFRPRFIDAVKMALAVYPEARVDIEDKKGLILHPSRPPVGEAKVVQVLSLPR